MRGRETWSAGWILAGVSLLLLLVVTLLYLWQTLSARVVINDAGLYAELSRLLLDPDRQLYADLWDNKPPGLFFFTLPFVILLGNSTIAIQLAAVLEALLFAGSTGLLITQITRDKTISLITTLIALYYAAVIVSTRSIETTLLMAACGTLSIWFTLKSAGKPHWMFAAGLLFAGGVLTKQPLALELPARLLLIWLLVPKNQRLSALAAYIAGGIAAGLLLLVWGFANQNLPYLWEYLVAGNTRYGQGEDRAATSAFYLLRETIPMLTPLLLTGLAALWLAFRRGTDRGLLLALTVWLLTGAVGAGIGAALKITYFLQIIPPLLLAAALGYGLLIRLRWLALLVLPAVLILSAQNYVAGFAVFRSWAHDPQSPTLTAAEYIQQQTAPDDCIWLWGYINNISYYSTRPSCTSVPYEAMVMNAAGFDIARYRPDYLRDLFANQPAFLVQDSPWDFFPMLQRFADRYRRERITELELPVFRMDFASWQPLQIEFADLFTLIGVDVLREDAVCAGSTLRYATTVDVKQAPGRYYQMFLQVRNAANERIVGVDLSPYAAIPTQEWAAGDLIVGDTIQLVLPANLPEGEYTVVLGFYNTDTLEALPLRNVSDNQTGTEISIDQFSISGSC